MSRGPGRIGRAIRTLFDANPDTAHTVGDLCAACYSDRKLERKHRVAMLRAVKSVVASDPDWRIRLSVWNRNMVVFYNAASVESTATARYLEPSRRGEAAVQWAREQAHAYRDSPREQDQEIWQGIEHKVTQHITLRDAEPAERERLAAQYAAEAEAERAEWIAAIRSLTGQLSVADRYRLANDNTCHHLAERLRALMVENDPDAVRAGLAEVADALDRLAGKHEAA
jgi:hypothetical protein